MIAELPPAASGDHDQIEAINIAAELAAPARNTGALGARMIAGGA